MQLHSVDFPVIVRDGSWSKTLKELKEDARLVLLNTGSERKIGIVMCFTETYITSGMPAGFESEVSKDESRIDTRQTEERILIQSIEELTKVYDLANKLSDCNRQEKV